MAMRKRASFAASGCLMSQSFNIKNRPRLTGDGGSQIRNGRLVRHHAPRLRRQPNRVVAVDRDNATVD